MVNIRMKCAFCLALCGDFTFLFYLSGISPQSTYDLPENVSPIVDTEAEAVSRLRKEPIIKLHRLTESVRFLFISTSLF